MSNAQHDMGGSSSRTQPAYPPNSSSGPFNHDPNIFFDTSNEHAVFSQDTSSVRIIPTMANNTVEVFSGDYHVVEQEAAAVSPTTSETIQEDQKEPESKPKRKRENRYKNAPPGVLTRRRAQNRASQRAYRERKEKRINDLEGELAQAQKREESLIKENRSLEAELRALKAHLAAKGWQNDVIALASDGLSTPCQQFNISALQFQQATHHYQQSHHDQQLQQQLLLLQQQQEQQLQQPQQQPPPANMMGCWGSNSNGYIVQQ